MSVEDTDFSPPATAVMFLLTIHPTALEAGDFLSTDVKESCPEGFFKLQENSTKFPVI